VLVDAILDEQERDDRFPPESDGTGRMVGLIEKLARDELPEIRRD
jgi:hypothetical protein